jgi:YjbE family integral membrane protein
MQLDFSILAKLMEVFWVNVLLSGDNAILIALACRNLPTHQRRLGIVLGSITAIVLRLAFSMLALPLLSVAGLKLAGAVLLVWVATGLILGDDDDLTEKIQSHDRLWRAVRAIALADLVLSLDNVLVIVGIAHDMPWMLVFGLVFSIPLIVWGSETIGALIAHYPALVYLGAGLIGWSAGELAVSDSLIAGDAQALSQAGFDYLIPAATAAMSIVGGVFRQKWMLRQRDRARNSSDV